MVFCLFFRNWFSPFMNSLMLISLRLSLFLIWFIARQTNLLYVSSFSALIPSMNFWIIVVLLSRRGNCSACTLLPRYSDVRTLTCSLFVALFVLMSNKGESLIVYDLKDWCPTTLVNEVSTRRATAQILIPIRIFLSIISPSRCHRVPVQGANQYNMLI